MGKMSNRSEMGAEEKEAGGESRRVGTEKMSNEKGKREQRNGTGVCTSALQRIPCVQNLLCVAWIEVCLRHSQLSGAGRPTLGSYS